MPSATWSFSSPPLPADKCRILAFTGDDAVCMGYTFDILLLADIQASRAQGMLADLVNATGATLRGKRADGSAFPWHGAVAEASHITSGTGGSLLHVRLRPRTHRLRMSRHSRLFMDMRLPQVLTSLLDEEGFNMDSDVRMNLLASYLQRPVTCQYDESSHAFLHRHLEREGAYSYIRQDGDTDVLTLADEVATAEALPLQDDLTWDKEKADCAILSLVRTVRTAPSSVTLRDYSSSKPGIVAATAQDPLRLPASGIATNRFGNHGLLGDMDLSAFVSADADAVARDISQACVRALVADSHEARGSSTVPWLRAGFAMSLEGERFQLVRVRHSCNLATDTLDVNFLREATDSGFPAAAAQPGYRNDFRCHPLSLGAFSPLRETPWPQVAGLVHARVDAEGSGKYAELDDQGRYKVEFFFPEKVIYADKGIAGPGKRSIPLHMMQSHAGPSSGVHFPLLKGAEVLVAFTDGDPDRPVILGTLPNPDNPSIVTDRNAEENVVLTPGGNKITLVDTEGSTGMHFETSDGRTTVKFLSSP